MHVRSKDFCWEKPKQENGKDFTLGLYDYNAH